MKKNVRRINLALADESFPGPSKRDRESRTKDSARKSEYQFRVRKGVFPPQKGEKEGEG